LIGNVEKEIMLLLSRKRQKESLIFKMKEWLKERKPTLILRTTAAGSEDPPSSKEEESLTLMV
jgi:hypothetical protein